MSKVRLYGSTSGYVELAAPAVADDATLTLPTAAAGFGKVLQVVQAVKTDTFSTTSTSFTDVTGLTVSITPSANTHKVLVVAQVVGGRSSNAVQSVTVARGGTPILRGGADGSRTRTTGTLAPHQDDYVLDSLTIVYLDSPNVNTATTYSVQTLTTNGSFPAYINRSVTDSNSALTARGASTITVIEVAA